MSQTETETDTAAAAAAEEFAAQAADHVQSIAATLFRQRLLFAFNQTFIDFLKWTKKQNKKLNHAIKQGYTCLDKLSEEYYGEWRAAWGEVDCRLDTDLWTVASGAACFRTLTLGQIGAELTEAAERAQVEKFLWLLRLFGLLLDESGQGADGDATEDTTEATAEDTTEATAEDTTEDNANEEDPVEITSTDATEEEAAPSSPTTTDSFVLFSKIIEILKRIDAKDATWETELEDIVNDDIVACLRRLSSLGVALSDVPMEGEAAGTNATGTGASIGAGAGAEIFENTKIGQLAKEITSKLDLDSLKNARPEDLMDIGKLFSGSNNSLSQIIQQVGSTITEKMQTGELKQEELIQDALGLMGRLGGPGTAGGMGDMMKNMMSMMGGFGGMGGSGRRTKTSSRDRMREKLKRRSAAGQAAGQGPQ